MYRAEHEVIPGAISYFHVPKLSIFAMWNLSLHIGHHVRVSVRFENHICLLCWPQCQGQVLLSPYAPAPDLFQWSNAATAGTYSPNFFLPSAGDKGIPCIMHYFI